MTDRTERNQDILVSMPVYKKFVGQTDPMIDFKFKRLFIRLRDENDEQTMDDLKKQFFNVYNTWSAE
jgi:hypothetical protein